MAENFIVYTLELDAYTPETLPQKLLGELLQALSDLYGQEDSVHFVGVETGSARVVSGVSIDADEEVQTRIEGASHGEGSPEAREAFNNVAAIVERSGAPGRFLNPNGATIYEFPTGEVRTAPAVYGPFWQQSKLRGQVHLIGGKGEMVSVKIQVENRAITCKARRGTAQELFRYMWGNPIQLHGAGQWIREASGEWKLLKFVIDSYTPLEVEPLLDTIEKLRAIEGDWKKRPDPLAELHDIRYGEDQE